MPAYRTPIALRSAPRSGEDGLAKQASFTQAAEDLCRPSAESLYFPTPRPRTEMNEDMTYRWSERKLETGSEGKRKSSNAPPRSLPDRTIGAPWRFGVQPHNIADLISIVPYRASNLNELIFSKRYDSLS
ncbi:hypothetical protein PG996_013792 [Apiospora saccharicola]|uniref:Uncharacterized protein n=1 Tax=Apiospora saccharicola TaxID=335842 RepID=A0ABR1TGH1_9PEZI